MLFKFIIPISFLVTAIAVEEYQMVNCRRGQTPPFQKLKREPIPLPRPAPGKPVIVKISAEITRVTLDEEKQEFETTFFFRQEWHDPRLAFDSKGEEKFRFVTNPSSLWTPDIFFVNDILNQTTSNRKGASYIKYFPNGRVFKAERKTVRASCPIDILLYPFDKQTCQLQIESYGHTIDDIILLWNKTENEPGVTMNLVAHDYVTIINPGLEITTFRNAEYTSPRVIFTISRTRTEIILRVMLPIVVITLCSWISFLFTWKEFGMRVSLYISPILTYILEINLCTAIFISPVYLTGLDIWAATSFVAMFISGVECAYIVYKKDPEDESSQTRRKKSDFKDRIALALFVTGLDILSIMSVFISRLF